jgi:hypothetical protein
LKEAGLRVFLHGSPLRNKAQPTLKTESFSQIDDLAAPKILMSQLTLQLKPVFLATQEIEIGRIMV